MIEQSHESLRVKKLGKNKKKAEAKMIEQEIVKQQKIQQEGKEISEMSEPNPQEEKKKQISDFYELLEDLISYLMLDHEEFKQQIHTNLQKLKAFDLSPISHKSIMAYSFLAKLTFIEKKIQSSNVSFDSKIVQKKREKVIEIFKQGLRQCENLKKFYKII